ncbi:MAG: DUF72 domain-containing protein [Planctomycetota bacterium]
MSGARVHIGTSGWNYRHWRGRFYPEKLRQADWLTHFAKHFGSVEVNNTFYRVPGVEHVRGWGQQAPAGFRFAVKMWRGITHFKKLKNCREHLETFFSPLSALAVSQRGPVLVQLPANQGKDLEKLDAFLTDLKAVTHPARWKIAIEFRNEAWLCSETHELLDRQRAAICLQDMPPADAQWPNDAAFVYVRRHGPEGDYRGSYPDAVIQEDARRINDWRGEGRNVFIYYNNDAEACAIHDARRLEKTLRELA